jgi:hypothetical protein
VTSFRLSLDDTDFARLAEAGRALIPSVEPGWTDHNHHDPGITLLELLAWTAEAQIYGLGRLRRDERLAYAALMGVHARAGRSRPGVWSGRPTFSRTGAPGAEGCCCRPTRR